MSRAERIRSYMDDSGMSRAEAKALVDFEDGPVRKPRVTQVQVRRDRITSERDA